MNWTVRPQGPSITSKQIMWIISNHQPREEKLIGRYVKDGFPAAGIDDVSRNVCSIIKLITRGHRIEENSVHIYAP